MGGSKSQSSNRGLQLSESTSGSFVDPSQQPFLDFLRQQGQGLAQQQLGGGSGFQQNVLNPAMQALAGQLGGDPNLLNQQIGAAQQSISENLAQNILPTIQSQAGSVGQLGSSRQGVAEGIALRDAARQASDVELGLRTDAQRRQLQALSLAPMVGGLQFQPLQNLAGLIGSPTLLNVGQSRSRGTTRGGSSSKGLSF